jgi:hypothetical protein
MASQSQASDAVDLPEDVETFQTAAQFRRELAQE